MKKEQPVSLPSKRIVKGHSSSFALRLSFFPYDKSKVKNTDLSQLKLLRLQTDERGPEYVLFFFHPFFKCEMFSKVGMERI